MKNQFLMLLVVLVMVSCDKKEKNNLTEVKPDISLDSEDAEGLKLLQQKCYACHSITTKSHDDIIAPPMIAVKRRYQRQYDSKADFVMAMVAYSIDPKEENALMYGAVNKFNAMPKQNFNKEDLIKIANYIYDNEIETPVWFEQHFKENKSGQGMHNAMNK